MKRLSIFFWSALLTSLAFLYGCKEDDVENYDFDQLAILSFDIIDPVTVNGEIVIEENKREIHLYIPEGTNLSDLEKMIPTIEVVEDGTISPASGIPQNFTAPVVYSVEKNGYARKYTTVVHMQGGSTPEELANILVVGTAPSAAALTNKDEKAAVTWALDTYSKASYIQLAEINEEALKDVDVLYWHHDATKDLPEVATTVAPAIQAFRDNGGKLFLTGFATQYLEILGVVPEGKGPNEIGGTNEPSENPDAWGISKNPAYADHAIFKGLDDPLLLVSGGTAKKDNKAWWFVGDDPTEFTGLPLAGTEWNPTADVLVLVAEFTDDIKGQVITISAGAYDWYSESGTNTYLENIHGLTKNALNYLYRCKAGEGNITPVPQINSFKFTSPVETEAIINGQEIMATVPFGTDLTAMVADVNYTESANISPNPSEALDYASPVSFILVNGDKTAEYTVVVNYEQPAIHSFKIINPVTATGNINETDIEVFVPFGTDVTAMNVALETTANTTITPSTDQTLDFSSPVTFILTAGDLLTEYTVTVIEEEKQIISDNQLKILVLGSASSADALTNIDEKAAVTWALGKYALAEYASLEAIKADHSLLNNHDVIWWHADENRELPQAAYDIAPVLKAYRENGGALLLTTYATQIIDEIGAVPMGKGPNAINGAAEPFENSDDWGMGAHPNHKDHPIFTGLSDPFFLLGGTNMRRDNGAFWDINPDNGNQDKFEGGIPLASFNWDVDNKLVIAIAEFPVTAQGNIVTLSLGSYDWAYEAGENTYKANIEKLTDNALKYLAQ